MINNKGENQYANILLKRGIVFKHHPPSIKLLVGKRTRHYQPDFYLPESDTYIEIISSSSAYYCNLEKYKAMILSGKALLVLRPNGDVFADNFRVFNGVKLKTKNPYNTAAQSAAESSGMSLREFILQAMADKTKARE